MALDSVSDFVSGLKVSGNSRMDLTFVAVVLACIICVMAPLELSQLVFVLAGAVAYALMQAGSKPLRSRAGATGKVNDKLQETGKRSYTSKAKHVEAKEAKPKRVPQDPNKTPKLQPSSMPVCAPTFKAETFETQVDELVGQISSRHEDDQIVSKLAKHVKATVQTILPEAEVMGFVSGDISRGTAFGVAVPEVDIVASVSPAVLVQALQGRLLRGASWNAGKAHTKLDARKLQKSAIRACTDVLVSHGGFKFRRSAFRGQEPKVTLLTPTWLAGPAEQAFPIDFSVNCVMPLYNAALLTECGQIDPRAKALILTVKRWAKDRGVCHAAKGHLPPYAWSLLVIYFLQTGHGERKLLPPLENFQVTSGLMAQAAGPRSATDKGKETNWQPDDAVASLFKEFVRFYNASINWRREAVSVRLGKRAQPDRLLDIHIIVREDGSTEVAPSVEDPFDPKRNLGSCMTSWSLDRLKEELHRADDLCTREASLTELLDPWKPPAGESKEDDDDVEA